MDFPEDPAVGAEGFAFGGGEGSGDEVVDGLGGGVDGA